MSESKAVLITGCSTGIGRATAVRLAGRGHTVYASARRLEAIQDLEREGCRLVQLDVTDEASMRSAVEQVVAAEGAVGALVNNAGYSQSGALEVLDMDDVRRQFETNVFGLLRMCQLVLPGMREQRRGRIVNISSIGGKLTFPGGGIYHATKHAVEGLSDVLRFEVKGFGVDVVIIEPGLIRSSFEETASASLPAESGPYTTFHADLVKAMHNAYSGPTARLGGGPENVAGAIEKAITARRPKPRYRVTPSAHASLTARALMPDRVWDAFMSTQFPRPRA